MEKKVKVRQLSLPRKLIYGSGEFFGGTATVIVLSIFHKFLVEYAGITPFLAGIAVFAGRFWDALTDPLMGSMSDRTTSRFGRRRPYFLIFSVPASLVFLLLWIPVPSPVMAFKVLYYALAYMLFSTFYTMLNTPWLALGPELTTDYNERTSLVTIRMVFSVLGSLFAGTVPNSLIQRFPDRGYLYMAAILGVIYTAIWLGMFFFLKEKPRMEAPSEVSFFQSFGLAMKNKSFRRLLGMYVAIFLAIDFVIASPRYLAEELFQRPYMVQLMMGVIILSMLAGLPLFSLITGKLGRKRALFWGGMIWILVLTGIFLTPRDVPTAPFLAMLVFMGLAMAAAFVVPWSALPETIDVDRLVNDRDTEGIYAGIMTFTRKLISSTVVLIIGTSLGLAGYVSEIPERLPEEEMDRVESILEEESKGVIKNAYAIQEGDYVRREDLSNHEKIKALNALKGAGYIQQPESVILAIRINSAVYPLLLVGAALVFSLLYPINREDHQLMRKKLDDEESLTTEEERTLGKFLDEAY